MENNFPLFVKFSKTYVITLVLNYNHSRFVPVIHFCKILNCEFLAFFCKFHKSLL